LPLDGRIPAGYRYALVLVKEEGGGGEGGVGKEAGDDRMELGGNSISSMFSLRMERICNFSASCEMIRIGMDR
jgi:hypothetical protein